MVIILLILITLSLDSVWILLGENCCWSLLALKGLTQLHRKFVSPISLVQFNWYCKCRGDNDAELTWGRNLLNIYFFFLALCSCSRASRSLSRTRRCFRREREENKTTSMYRLGSTILPKDKIKFRTILTRSIISNYQ